jgi:hypothetical protein
MLRVLPHALRFEKIAADAVGGNGFAPLIENALEDKRVVRPFP